MTKEAIPKPQRSYELMMFAEHYQFYMYDSEADPGELSVYWDEQSRDNMLMVSDRILGIGTVRHLDVPVMLEIYDEEPKGEPLDEYDHVARCSMKIPSGKVVIAGATEDIYQAQKFDVAPGAYGVRVYYGALAEVDEEGFEGEDFYKIAIWPTDKPPRFEVMKQWQEKPKFMY
jgi:hypothetical protein